MTMFVKLLSLFGVTVKYVTDNAMLVTRRRIATSKMTTFDLLIISKDGFSSDGFTLLDFIGAMLFFLLFCLYPKLEKCLF